MPGRRFWSQGFACCGRWRCALASVRWLRAACAVLFAAGAALEAAEHPFLIVRAGDYAELQALASRSPWREIRNAAISTSNGTTISATAGVRDRAFNLNKIMEATALAYIVDPANRDRYRDRFYTYLKYWDTAQPGNITQGLTDDTWDGSVPTGAAFFFTVVAMDIIGSDPGTTPAQAAQRADFVALMEKPGGTGQMGPARFFGETPFEFHLTAHRAAKGIWALWKGDAGVLAAAVADYRRSWLEFITEDGVYRENSGYGLARSGEPSRSHKHFFADVLVHTGTDPGWYAQPRMQKFYEWLGGYALMPNRWTWPIGDSSYTSYTGGYNSNFDRSERYSALAGRYGQWAKNGGLGVNTLFPYILTPRVNAPAPLEAPSRIFADGGAWLKQDGGGREAFAAVLVNQTYTPTAGLGHIHKEQNSLHLAALGEVLLRGSGYNGWNSNDPINGGFSFAYTNNHAVSSNVALFDYNIGNEKDPSFTNDHRKLGGLGVKGLLSAGLDYASGDTGPPATPQSAIPNGRHVRHVAAIYPQDGVNAYAICLDELAGLATTVNAHLAWHPHSDTISVNADNSSDREYEFAIKQTVNRTDQLQLSLYLPTAPNRQQIYSGLFGEDISGARPYRTFVGRYVFLTYALDSATRRRNVLSAFYPRRSTQAKPAMERIVAPSLAAGAATTTASAAVFTHAGGVRDFAFESDGLAERLIASPTSDAAGAIVRAKFAVYRKLTAPAGDGLAFYFVAQGRSFKDAPGPFSRGFVADAEVTLHVKGSVGAITSPGTTVTFYQPGHFEVRLGGQPAVALSSGDGFARVSIPAGTHRLDFAAVTAAPAITLQPSSRVLQPGAPLLLQVSASGAVAFQWFRDGVELTGETTASLYRAATTAADAGAYTVRVTNAFGVTVSTVAAVGFDAAASRAANLSCRTHLDAGGMLIPGFVVAGHGRKTVLIRAIGPGLAAFGLSGVLPDPRLRVFRGTDEIAGNEDWVPATVGNAAALLGAFPLPTGSKDAAVLLTLEAGERYSVHVSGAGAGTVLLELYDADSSTGEPSTARLANVSVRGRTGVADAALIMGIVVQGAGSRPFLIRGGGPALAAFGVSGTLADPRIELFDAARRSLLTNDDWPLAPFPLQLDEVRARVGAFAYVAGSRDAAMLATLSPGAYMIHVTGADARPGEVLLEVYESP